MRLYKDLKHKDTTIFKSLRDRILLYAIKLIQKTNPESLISVHRKLLRLVKLSEAKFRSSASPWQKKRCGTVYFRVYISVYRIYLILLQAYTNRARMFNIKEWRSLGSSEKRFTANKLN